MQRSDNGVTCSVEMACEPERVARSGGGWGGHPTRVCCLPGSSVDQGFCWGHPLSSSGLERQKESWRSE